MVEQDDVEIAVTNIVNPASFLGGNQGEIVEHDCLETIEAVYSSCPDLKDTPWEGTEDWFTDGSSYMVSSTRCSGYAVTTTDRVLDSGPLPASTSAQKAEIIALTKALEEAKELRVNIWTDSKYAFGVVHAHGAIWKERGLLNSQGKTIKHATENLKLLEAVQLPEKVAIMHVKAHQKVQSAIEKGNELADREAKRVARVEQGPSDSLLKLPDSVKKAGRRGGRSRPKFNRCPGDFVRSAQRTARNRRKNGPQLAGDPQLAEEVHLGPRSKKGSHLKGHLPGPVTALTTGSAQQDGIKPTEAETEVKPHKTKRKPADQRRNCTHRRPYLRHLREQQRHPEINGVPVWHKEKWQQILKIAKENPNFHVEWIPSHQTNLKNEASKWNNYVDELARIDVKEIRSAITEGENQEWKRLLEWLHCKRGHSGIFDLYKEAQARGWPVTREQCKTVISSCDLCKIRLGEHPLTSDHLHIREGKPLWSTWQVDYIGPFRKSGNKQYIIVIVEVVSRLTCAEAVSKANGEKTVHFLEKVFGVLPKPTNIQSDNGTHFTSHLVQQWAKREAIKWTFHVPYYPQANGIVEHTNGLIKSLIRPQDYRWDERLRYAVSTINNRWGVNGCSCLNAFFPTSPTQDNGQHRRPYNKSKTPLHPGQTVLAILPNIGECLRWVPTRWVKPWKGLHPEDSSVEGSASE
ncbi:uncharacterized protein LOC127395148 [Apus apus]|uniref:uncharacterized protein LOC127395148 n=1 Tax=Apus apus TaxID=8895 RepID=UPI0021F88836|nr:uncharacterized protein LOC127395148 [Apus apus]